MQVGRFPALAGVNANLILRGVNDGLSRAWMISHLGALEREFSLCPRVNSSCLAQLDSQILVKN